MVSDSLLLALGPGVLALAALGWTYGLGIRAQRALLRVPPSLLRHPVCVLIPARNEATRLPATLDALCQEPSALLHIVVYNDASTDETWNVLQRYAQKDARILVVDGAQEPPPQGFGKPAALAGALSCAQKAVWWNPQMPLLCLDADVLLAKGALGALVHAFGESGAAALSGVPHLALQGWVERFWVPTFVALAARRFAPERVHRRGDARAFLNGQLILLRFEALHAIGGFAAVSDAVLEDVAMGENLKAAGFEIRLADLRDLATTRMYTSFRELADGFGKNAVPLQGGIVSTILVAISGFVLSLAAPWSMAMGCWHESLSIRASAALCGVAIVGLQVQLRRQLRVSAWPTLFSPLIYFGVCWVYFRAAWRVWRGSNIAWRGRDYPASRR